MAIGHINLRECDDSWDKTEAVASSMVRQHFSAKIVEGTDGSFRLVGEMI